MSVPAGIHLLTPQYQQLASELLCTESNNRLATFSRPESLG
ncbi:MAG TPA: hypothetical protein VMW24_05065 [Sedimentisphaerales bacterium]|nr:hypothetical protein [Sedimentisphaerales bacterium]